MNRNDKVAIIIFITSFALYMIFKFELRSTDIKTIYGNELKDIEPPEIEQIKTDLLGKKIGIWNFDKKEEIRKIRIMRQEVSNKNKLLLNCKLDLIGYNTNHKFQGDISIEYILDQDNKWNFESVRGEITSNEKSANNDEQDKDVLQRFYDTIVKDQVQRLFSGESNKTPNYIKCHWCGRSFNVNEGVKCCDEEMNNSGASGLTSVKYCTRSCACEAEKNR